MLPNSPGGDVRSPHSRCQRGPGVDRFLECQLFDLLARYGAPVLFLGQMLGIFGPIPDELLLTSNEDSPRPPRLRFYSAV